MNKSEADDCITHSECLIDSDSLFTCGGAHPRIAGTFPKALRILRKKGFDWQSALSKITNKAVDRLRIRAGRLCVGAIADIVVFDPDNFIDQATFHSPFLSPTGVYLVVINGKIILT